MEYKFYNVFVTVGTTKFDKLISAVLEKDTIKILKQIGCQNLKIQIGSGTNIPINAIDDIDIVLNYYRYKDSILEDISEADLVISHAGAGTCLDVLKNENHPRLISVINDSLMDNHQMELAEKLYNEGYSLSCNCDTLADTLKIIPLYNFKPFYYNYDELCARYIENLIHKKQLR